MDFIAIMPVGNVPALFISEATAVMHAYGAALQALEGKAASCHIVVGSDIATPVLHEAGFVEAVGAACQTCPRPSCFLMNDDAVLGISAVKALIRDAPVGHKPVCVFFKSKKLVEDAEEDVIAPVRPQTITRAVESWMLKDLMQAALAARCTVSIGTPMELHDALMMKFAVLKSSF